MVGIKEFKHILEAQPSQTMKAITLYELGMAYTKQHKYIEAIIPVTESMKIAQNKKGLRDVCCWPGTESFIQHTDVTVLKVCCLHALHRITHRSHGSALYSTGELSEHGSASVSAGLA